MKHAAEFARFASAIGVLASQIKPADSDPYAQARKLIQYHLQVAASSTRQIAEALAKKKESK